MSLEMFDSSKLFESVYNNSGIAIALVDASGKLIKANEFFCDWLGYSEEEMLNMTFAQFTYKEDINVDVELYQELIEGKRDYYQLEKRYIAKNGEIVWGELSVSLIRDEKNAPQMGIGMVKDITANKKRVNELFIKANELQNALDKLNEIQKISKIGIWEVDLTTNNIHWSDEVYNIHEVELGTELKIEEGINFYREDYRELIQSVINESIEQQKSWDVECVLVTAKGNEIWVRAIGYPVYKEEEVVGLHGLFMNIDEAKKKERTLFELNEKLELSVESGQIAIWIWNLQTNNLEWNDMAYTLFGVEKDVEPTFELFASMIHPEDLESVQNAAQSTIESSEKFDIVFRFIKPDGTEILLSGRGDIVYDSEGTPIEFIGINLDITERMQMLESIRIKEIQLRNFVEQAPVAVAMLDSDLKYISVSNQWFQHFNIEERNIIGDFHLEVLPIIKEKPEWLDHYKSVLEGEELSIAKDKIVFDDGTMKWVSRKLIPWFSKSDEIGGIIIFTADITHEVNYTNNLETEVANRTKELLAVNEELESFSYTISHDLRAPLRTVNGFSDILLQDYKDKLDENGVRLLNIVKDGAIKMGSLIDAVLKFSRLGKQSLRLETINMKSLFNVTVNNIIISNDYKEAEVEIKELHDIRGDASLLEQVVTNLLSNAFKYSAEQRNTRIIIDSEIENEYVKYSIKDNGVGFNIKYHHKIYGVFQRLHAESEFEGTGVGLAIVKRIINKHKGSVWAESKLGEGSTFYFTIPRNI